MTWLKTGTARILAHVERRFGTKAARFRSAVALGFVITLAGVSVGPQARALLADESLFGSLSALFGTPAPQATPYRLAYEQATRHARHAAQHRRVVARRHPSEVRPIVAKEASADQSICVRLCDGYTFPVGSYRGSGDKAAHTAMCQSACPDAQTALFVLPKGAESIANASDVNTGRRYSALPDAYRYTTFLDDACTCHRGGANGKALSLLRDFTLRRGDAIMTPTGVKVFHGGGHYPYRPKDFVTLARAHEVRPTDRATFRAIERASLRGPVSDRPSREAARTDPEQRG